MRKTKLILLEGVPGSGKSTAAAGVQALLEKRGHTTRFWREGDFDHPADYEGVACVSAALYRDFLARFPASAGALEQQLTVRAADHLISYRRLQQLHPQVLPPALLDELSHYDVYDGLPMAEYRRLALLRWRDFRQAAQCSDTITILECCLLQNPLTVLLARHDADEEVVRRHIASIAAIVKDLCPLVIYLSPSNVRAALENVRAGRPKEWADFVTGYLTRQAYGATHQLAGFEGVIRFYEMRQRLELELLCDLPLRSLVVECAAQDWERCNREIAAFLDAEILS